MRLNTNKIPYYQDFRYLIGVPAGVDFTVEGSGAKTDHYWLTGYGYGQLGGTDTEGYGNGSIRVNRAVLSKDYRKKFRDAVGKAVA